MDFFAIFVLLNFILNFSREFFNMNNNFQLSFENYEIKHRQIAKVELNNLYIKRKVVRLVLLKRRFGLG